MYFQSSEIEKTNDAELMSDWAVDLKNKKMKLRGGRQYKVYGSDALRIWIHKQLLTQKGVFSAYSENMGSDIKELCGIAQTDLLYDELERVITECLIKSSYIKNVSDFEFSRDGSEVRVSFEVESIYGSSKEEFVADTEQI